MERNVYDVIVIGGGIIGTSTACKLATERKRVLLIDQFLSPNSCGSSRGRSRGVEKRAFFESSDAIRLMREYSFLEWNSLDKKQPGKFMRQNRLLLVGRQSDLLAKFYDDINARNDDNPNPLLDWNELHRQFPHLVFPTDYAGHLDRDTRTLFADEILKYFVEEFINNGGEFVNAKVTGIKPNEIVEVFADSTMYKSKKVLLATGPWSNTLLSDLELSVQLETLHVLLMYWKIKSQVSVKFEHTVSIAEYDDDVIWANVTPEYGTSVKIVMNGEKNVDPDQINAIDNTVLKERLLSYKQKRFKNLEDSPIITENCIMSFPPDGKPLIGTHPNFTNVVIGVGMCGWGFGLSPAISLILSDLLCDKCPQFDTKEFSLSRFTKH